jgi:hypothetical protein
MLDSFYYKSGLFSLLALLGGDVLVMEDNQEMLACGDYAMWYAGGPGACEEMSNRTEQTPWRLVNWDNYDVVVSAGKIVPKNIIDGFPNVLWMVAGVEYTAYDYKPSQPAPYDCYWDYTSIEDFPYMVDSILLRSMITAKDEKDGIWLPSRAVRPHCPGAGVSATISDQPIIQLAGLPVFHPNVWNLGRTYQAILQGLVQPPREIWENMSRCRYMLNIDTGALGQPLLEAAALGLIVISTKTHYEKMVAPACRVKNFEQALDTVAMLERSPEKRAEILNYQAVMLGRYFWTYPLIRLKKMALGKQGK